MRRNNFSLILPDKRCNSTLSLNMNRRPSTHIVQSPQNRSFTESLFDDQFENYFLLKRRKSSVQCAKIVVIEYSSTEHRSSGQLIRAGTCLTPILNNLNEKSNSCKGETLIHLSARLGHEHILRRLIQETSYATRLTNAKGQTPLLCAIQSSNSSIAIFLMEIDPITITVHDNNQNSVFHYAANLCDDIVLSRAISLIKRLNNPHQRIKVKIFFYFKLI
jgi:ankyrin repeat protein